MASHEATIVITGAARTPVGAFNGALASLPAHTLGEYAIRAAMSRSKVEAAEVDAFAGRLGVVWRGELQKSLEVWYFADCEVVYYTATSDGRTVRCVEFEAVRQVSVTDALAVIARYEQATGFDAATRSRQSLVGLLFPGVLPPR